jgi:YQGE family putative transporter
MFIGIAAVAAVVLPFFWRVNYFTLLVFGVGSALFVPLYIIPVTSVVFDLIGREKDGAENRVEYVVIREVGMNAGRIFGTLVFIAIVSRTSSPFAMNLMLFGFSLSPLLVWGLLLPWLKSPRVKKPNPAPEEENGSEPSPIG